MATVRNKDRYGHTLSLDQMLRRFKKQVEKDEILLELRRRECFIPKSVKLKIKSQRHQRLVRKLEEKSPKV